MIFSYLLNMQSHPSWVCGLKLNRGPWHTNLFCVTPFVGVWIETLERHTRFASLKSHPSWVCGLKLVNL